MMAHGNEVEVHPPSQSCPELNSNQTTQACKVLIRHIQDSQEREETTSSKPDLLKEDEDTAQGHTQRYNDSPIWMILTTKRHIVDKKRLKPTKVPVPHSLQATSKGSICLITADPQRLYKDALAHPSFPDAQLSRRITRVIGLSKLKAKYKSFESRRQLLSEHDIFLADSRVVIYLPTVLGKVFYKGGVKRPIPLEISGPRERDENGKRIKAPPISVRKKMPNREGQGAASPIQIAKELRRAIDSALVHLAPGVSTAVKVANASFDPEMCTNNIEAVLKAMTERLIPQGWKNVRAIHVKGPNTAAFPIWMAGELWLNEEDVLEEKKVQGKKGRKGQPNSKEVSQAGGSSEPGSTEGLSQSAQGQKRKAETDEQAATTKLRRKKRKGEQDAKLAAESNARKEKLKQRKALAMSGVQDSVAK